MKKLKKLSLENEMKKEAEQIEKKVREDKSLDDITVSDAVSYTHLTLPTNREV